MDRLLFGLGNPGKGYAATRHNAGWQVLDHLLADEPGAAGFRRTRLVHGEVADLVIGDRKVVLVKPASFMNLVGPVYLRALEVYDLAPEQALVLVDDFALPFGRTRLRADGRHGGHNGLRSLEEALGTTEYPRLRLGIGPMPEAARWAEWVLKRYDAVQKRALPELLARGADAARLWAREGLEAAANRFNGDV
ncbi:MAG: aminoacyl-tRNA hydrolase [Planctomycetota bacterium]